MQVDTEADTSHSINAATKRKREPSDDGDKQPNSADSNDSDAPAVDGDVEPPKRTEISKDMVRNYFLLLERCGISMHPLICSRIVSLLPIVSLLQRA